MSNWTIVTGFFQTPEGLGHSLEKYKERSNFTLGLDHQMIIYCDSSLIDFIREKRKAYDTKTIIHEIGIKDLPYAKYIDQITENRKNNYPCGYPDPRNTPWYFIVTMSKFTFLDMALKENPFSSTHFMWLDFGYNQVDADPNLINDIFKENRNLFSCCLIDYFPVRLAYIPSVFYKEGGPCSVGAGVLTGSIQVLPSIIEKMEEEFISVVNAGYGHSEQSILYVLLCKYAPLFRFYVGDYYCLLKNYVKPVELNTTNYCLIPHIVQDKNTSFLNRVFNVI